MSRAAVTNPGGAPHGKSVGRQGDVLEVRGLPGWSSRRGLIVEVLGGPGHEHYRVKWDEEHESIVFPSADGVRVIPRTRA
jgi:hypothetical protein